jgi:NADH-quinone oxidoreductase subunit L
MDRVVIDGFLNTIARAAWGTGVGLRRYFDSPVINGAGDALSTEVRRFGISLKFIQSGRVQQYLITGIALVVAIGILFYYLLVLA